MRYSLGKAAPIFLVWGIFCISEGIAISLWPDISLSALIYFFGFSITIQGIIQTVYGTYKSLVNPWMMVLYLGVLNIIVGLFLILYPHIPVIIFILSVAITWTLGGLVLLLLAFYLNRETRQDPWLILCGILSIVAGIYVVINFQKGIISLFLVIALYNFLFGINSVVFGIKSRPWSHMHYDDTME
jgi:uncharacterized membrane protein HdeD (DUF308 family)